MTPEELDKKIEFIIESQARLAAAQEQDRADRIVFQQWSEGLSNRMARLLEHQSQLLEHQSGRMDRLDKFYEDWLLQDRDFQERSLNFQQQALNFQQQALSFQQQALRLLNMILDRLPPASQN